ncbi:hypothetical protein CBER1_06560 [Cercospora berteroae]|uniref:SnoaL-like domain-containing protein n=1 Tax=Cercospora berteroae TaxID=357750 RepID=A0A2S6C3J4_9PEZI|nr:hypothetical protein CBER1_06560 [Cercospora berteroae]
MAAITTVLENIKRVVQVTIDSLNVWDYQTMMAVRSRDFQFQALPSSLEQKELNSEEFRDLWHDLLTPTFKSFKITPSQQIFDADGRKAMVYSSLKITIPSGRDFEYDMIQIMCFNEDGTLMTRLEEFFDSKAYLEVLENVVAFRADSLSGPWSQPFFVSKPYTRTYNSQSGFSIRISGTEQTTYLYVGDQWDSRSVWESRYIWLPMQISEENKTLELEWHDVYDLDVEKGTWSPVEGETYYGKDAIVEGDAFKQEANFASGGLIVTGISGNESTVTFEGIEGSGNPQWVSFYYQNTDDMGFGDQPGGTPDRIGGTWVLRRISGVIVNGDETEVHELRQRDSHKGIILSTPLLLTLNEGSNNTITIGGLSNGNGTLGADIDRIVVYPAETQLPPEY